MPEHPRPFTTSGVQSPHLPMSCMLSSASYVLWKKINGHKFWHQVWQYLKALWREYFNLPVLSVSDSRELILEQFQQEAATWNCWVTSYQEVPHYHIWLNRDKGCLIHICSFPCQCQNACVINNLLMLHNYHRLCFSAFHAVKADIHLSPWFLSSSRQLKHQSMMSLVWQNRGNMYIPAWTGERKAFPFTLPILLHAGAQQLWPSSDSLIPGHRRTRW